MHWYIVSTCVDMDYMLTVHTHTNCFAEQPCQLAPPCCHTQHTAGMYTHIIMQGDVSGPLHYAWSSGEPGQWSVRERPRSEPHCRTHVSTVTPPLHGPQTHIHTHACAHTHTPCTYSHTSLSSLTNLYTDSLTRSLSDKSQCDLFRVSIPLFVNWLR